MMKMILGRLVRLEPKLIPGASTTPAAVKLDVFKNSRRVEFFVPILKALPIRLFFLY